MRKYQTIFKYVGIAAIVLLLIGLSGWYFFLRNRTDDIAANDAARGFNIAVPSFTGSRSSTSENIAGGVGGDSLLFVSETNQRPPRLWRVSQSPVAGMGFLAGTATLRYVERSTGYVYDVAPRVGTIERRTNTLMPKIYDADIVSDGTVVLHTLDESAAKTTFLGRVSTTTSEDGFYKLDTTPLGSGVRAVAPSPARPEILATTAFSGGGGVLIRSTSMGDTPELVLPLPLASLQPLWLSDGRMFVSERPASGVAGSVYMVASTTLQPVARNIPGLVALPRASSTALLYSSDDGIRLRLFVHPSVDTSALELFLQTTAAKCVWAPGVGATSSPATAYCAVPQDTPPTQFTDQWLRGVVHTQDSWFKLDASTGKTDRFFIPETSVAIDVESPVIDARGEYITFINARDKSLWVLRISE